MALDLPPLHWLRAFEASARHLSFTGAAGELNMTQSAVSQQIKALEGHMGMALFHRRPRALALTEAGLAYLPFVRDAFRTLGHGTRSVTGQRQAEVRVHCNMSFATFWLAPRLGAFYDLFPDVRLNVMAEIWEPQGPISGADVEIRYSMRPALGVRAEPLAREWFYPVAHPEWSGGLEDIRKTRLFDVSNLLSSWSAWAEDIGQDWSDVVICHATTFAVSLNAAVAGVGLAMGHDTVCNRLIAEGRLKRVGDHKARMSEAYHLIIGDNAADVPGALDFADWVRRTRAAEASDQSGRDGTQA